MLNRINPALLGAGRVLPLRNAQFSLQGQQALALRGQIWFTPEAVIWDAFCVVHETLLAWRTFQRLVSIFALRVAIVFALIFLLAAYNQLPQYAAAETTHEAREEKAVNKD